MSEFILAIDQGTSSSRALIFDRAGNVVSIAQEEFRQYFPNPGWVEHDANEIWLSVCNVIEKAIQAAGIKPEQIKAIGITNQRETTVVWDKNSGKPVHKAIVWQSRQTENICSELKLKGYEKTFKEKTGLVVDSYFSGPKIKFILDSTGLYEKAQNGELLFGTIDSWLLWKLTGGDTHATDFTNASRTMIFNIHTMEWDTELLDILGIPPMMLPEVKESASVFGFTKCKLFNNSSIAVAGIAGDQQAALFGQNCFHEGQMKNTYGTGCFLLMNTGMNPVNSTNGLLTTVACDINGKPCYALEGSVFVAGSAVQWLRDGLEIIGKAAESEKLALELESNEGVYAVPSFAGLGTPYWKSEVRGAVFGLTRGSGRNHFARAILESIAYQVKDIVLVMSDDSGLGITDLKVDGGAVDNLFLMQFQSDLLNCKIIIPDNRECTVTGAARLAGLGSGFWTSQDIAKQASAAKEISPAPGRIALMAQNYAGWKKAVNAAIKFSEL